MYNVIYVFCFFFLQSLSDIARLNDGRVVCPRTKEIFHLDDAEKVFVMWYNRLHLFGKTPICSSQKLYSLEFDSNTKCIKYGISQEKIAM